ncbi:MAG: hypothetical protein LM558_03210 [Thermosphaera sp.]|nr:hypothetical protein [Thermosphaera sp.]
MSREAVAFRIRKMIYDLNLLQNRLVSVLFDVIYPDGTNSHVLLIMNMKENREFMQRLLKDIDEILKLMTESRP